MCRCTFTFISLARAGGVEIGVAKGVNAESIIETLNIEHMFLVDPYCSYVEDGRLYQRALRRERTSIFMIPPKGAEHHPSETQLMALVRR